MAASACAWTDGATVAASIDEDDAITDVDAVAGVDTEEEAVAPARNNDAFPISNYCLQTASLLKTWGGFFDRPSLCQRFHKALVKVIAVAKLPVMLNNN